MLTVIGEALIDLVDRGGGTTYAAHPGGSPLNVAVGSARLGLRTALMSRFGPDAFGTLLRRHAQNNGIELGAAVSAAEPSTLAVVTLDEQARATYDFWITATADWQWTEAELARVPAETTLLHVGSLASWLEPGAARIAALVRRERVAGRRVLSYDPNVRPRLLGEPDSARALIEPLAGAAHVVKASDEDLAWLYPGQDPEAVAAGWHRLGARLVVITRGPDGASVYPSSGTPRHRAGRRVAVADTVGAGDAFMSGLLTGLDRLGIHRPGQLDRLEAGTVLDDLIDRAVLVAALTCARPGADPPSAAELAAAG